MSLVNSDYRIYYQTVPSSPGKIFGERFVKMSQLESGQAACTHCGIILPRFLMYLPTCSGNRGSASATNFIWRTHEINSPTMRCYLFHFRAQSMPSFQFCALSPPKNTNLRWGSEKCFKNDEQYAPTLSPRISLRYRRNKTTPEIIRPRDLRLYLSPQLYLGAIYWSLNSRFALCLALHTLVDLASPPKTVCMHKILTSLPFVPFEFFLPPFFSHSAAFPPEETERRTKGPVFRRKQNPIFSSEHRKGLLISKRGSKCSKDPSEQDIRKARSSLRIQEVEGNGKLNELYPLKMRLRWGDTRIPKGCNFLEGES